VTSSFSTDACNRQWRITTPLARNLPSPAAMSFSNVDART
jgi:hypothetical protein